MLCQAFRYCLKKWKSTLNKRDSIRGTPNSRISSAVLLGTRGALLPTSPSSDRGLRTRWSACAVPRRRAAPFLVAPRRAGHSSSRASHKRASPLQRRGTRCSGAYVISDDGAVAVHSGTASQHGGAHRRRWQRPLRWRWSDLSVRVKNDGSFVMFPGATRPVGVVPRYPDGRKWRVHRHHHCADQPSQPGRRRRSMVSADTPGSARTTVTG